MLNILIEMFMVAMASGRLRIIALVLGLIFAIVGWTSWSPFWFAISLSVIGLISASYFWPAKK